MCYLVKELNNPRLSPQYFHLNISGHEFFSRSTLINSVIKLVERQL